MLYLNAKEKKKSNRGKFRASIQIGGVAGRKRSRTHKTEMLYIYIYGITHIP